MNTLLRFGSFRFAIVQFNLGVSVKPSFPELLLILYCKARFNSTQMTAKQRLSGQLRVYRKEHGPFIGPQRKVFPPPKGVLWSTDRLWEDKISQLRPWLNRLKSLLSPHLTNHQQKRGLYRIGIGPELMQRYDPIARHSERGEAERGNLKSTSTAAT